MPPQGYWNFNPDFVAGIGLRYNLRVSKAYRPKLGQHFLHGEGFRKRIADSLPLQHTDLVVEIGPGRGAMTGLLAERAQRLIAVELDSALAAELRSKLATHPRVEVLEADFLTIDIATLCQERGAPSCFVFGNIPYYITSPIIHRLMDSAGAIHGAALLMQREVAERLTAAPGSRHYGYLSVLVQSHGEPRIVFNVPPGAFSPPPEVKSALVEFRMKATFPSWTRVERAAYLAFVQRCFAQKRKNLLNNLSAHYSKDRVKAALEGMRLTEKARAEELSVAQFAELLRRL